MHTRLCNDIVSVGTANAVALAVSLGEFEQWVRIAGLCAALIYTVIRIVQAIREK